MKINSRLVIAFLLLLLVPLLFSHVAAYRIGSSMLTDRVQQQVESAVAMQKARVAMMMTHNLERLALVLSRTQLRQSLKAFLASSSQEQYERITSIIADARSSIKSFEAISVTTLEGKVIASTNAALIGSDQSNQQWFARASQGPIGDYLFLDRKRDLKILLSGPLLHEGKALGVLFITAATDDLLAITGDYSGLGATGETLLARKNSTGLVQILTPLRFDAAAALARTYPDDDMTYPIVQAVAGKAVQVPWGRDYRGRDVIAASAFIPNPGWGLVVKIDRDEALAPVNRQQIFLVCVLALSLALTSAVSWWLSQTITKPLVRLIAAAEKIGEGNLSTPLAEVRSTDEIGQLGKTFEEMRQKLGRTLEELREQTNHSRMSEARYRELVENINSGVAIFNYLAEKQEFVLIDINSRSIESDTIKLPVFNTIAINIQQEMAKLDPDIKLVEKNITADQALSTRVLRIANSSFYRGLNEISTIKSAIMRLGAEEITKIVLLATTKELFKSKNKLINELMTKLWLHSLGCAYGSAWLSRRHIYAVDQCESFFAGLLHDIGKLLVLMVIDEVNSHEIQNKLSDSLCHEAMEKLHTQEGGKLLDQWGIPKKFCFIATEHHSTIISDNNLLLVLVRMANIACQKIGIGMKIDETLILPATIEANILNLSEIDLAELEIFLEDTQKLFSDRP